MSIRVTPKNEDVPVGTFESATGYHVDDHGQLHVTEQGNGNIATYHSSAWLSVERVEDGK